MNHQIDHDQFNDRFTADKQSFMVIDLPAILAEPTEYSFHHPPFEHDHETVPLVAFHNLQSPMNRMSRPFDELARTTTVCPDQKQPAGTTHQFLQGQFCSIPVLNVGRVQPP